VDVASDVMQRPSDVLGGGAPIMALPEPPEFHWLEQLEKLMEVHKLPAPPSIGDLSTDGRECIEESGNVFSAFIDRGLGVLKGNLVFFGHAKA